MLDQTGVPMQVVRVTFPHSLPAHTYRRQGSNLNDHHRSPKSMIITSKPSAKGISICLLMSTLFIGAILFERQHQHNAQPLTTRAQLTELGTTALSESTLGSVTL